MTSISQNLAESEAEQRIEWIREHLGRDKALSGTWQMVRYQWSHRVRLDVYFNHPEDQTFYLLKWS